MQVLQDGAPVTDITPGSADPYTPGFALVPSTSAAPRASLPGPWLQFMSEGIAVGEASVAIVDLTGDPERIVATRGVGENSHVVTVRMDAAPPAAKSPGWMTDILDSGSTPLHANEGYGTYQDFISPPGVTIQHETYAGIEGYAGETIVWTPTWTPQVSDPSPTVTPLAGGKVEVYWDTIGGGWPKTSQGTLTLECTVNGSPAPAAIELVSGVGGDYTQMAWGPVP